LIRAAPAPSPAPRCPACMRATWILLEFRLAAMPFALLLTRRVWDFIWLHQSVQCRRFTGFQQRLAAPGLGLQHAAWVDHAIVHKRRHPALPSFAEISNIPNTASFCKQLSQCRLSVILSTCSCAAGARPGGAEARVPAPGVHLRAPLGLHARAPDRSLGGAAGRRDDVSLCSQALPPEVPAGQTLPLRCRGFHLICSSAVQV